jgi:hypothetical protein
MDYGAERFNAERWNVVLIKIAKYVVKGTILDH